jgi:hypothetical protein
LRQSAACPFSLNDKDLHHSPFGREVAVKLSGTKWQVSVWIGFDRCDPDFDALKELCGVKQYDPDGQEIIVDYEGWKEQPIESLLSQLSYSSSFLAEALSAARKKRSSW